MTTLIADSINYKNANVIHGDYQWTKLYPIEGLTNYPLASTQGATTTFQLSPNVFNLSKVKLCGTLALPAQGANNYSFTNVKGFKLINRITVQPQAGTSPYLMDFIDLDRYLDIVSRKEFSFSDVQTWDPAQTYANARTGTTFFEGLIPSNFPAATGVRLDNSAMIKPGQESQWVCAGGVNSATYLDFKFGFDKFVDTILAIDHDLFWNSNLTVTIYWNTLNRYTWMLTSATNPTTGAAFLPVTAGAAIQNPYVMLPIQNNKIIKKDIMERCLSQGGLTIKLPFIYQQSASINAGGNNIQVYYHSGQGNYLQKIYWTAYPQTPATPNLTYDKNNLALAKITQYYTQLNGENIQQNIIVPTSADEFLMKRNLLRGSDTLCFNEFLYNWSHEENFCEENYRFLKDIFPEVPEDNLVDGIPMLNQIQYNIVFNSAVNLTNVMFSVFLRTLRISGENITFV